MTGPQAYAACMVGALATAFLLRRPSRLSPWQSWMVGAGAVAGAGIGAKLPFVLLAREGFFAGAVWFAEGKTILSGLAGGYLGVEIVKALLGVRIKTGDGFAVPLAASIAVGRLGCFFNGCCSAPGIPVPLFESAFHAAMAIVLWRVEGNRRLRWQLLKLYFIAYAAFRFGIEFVRVEPRVALGLTAYQYGSLALAGAMIVLWRMDETRKRMIGAGLDHLGPVDSRTGARARALTR